MTKLGMYVGTTFGRNIEVSKDCTVEEIVFDWGTCTLVDGVDSTVFVFGDVGGTQTMCLIGFRVVFFLFGGTGDSLFACDVLFLLFL